MRVLLNIEFAANRKEPLADAFDRVIAAFEASGGCIPTVRFSLAEGLIGGGVSSVDRVLQRFPAMEPFQSETAGMPPLPSARQLSNEGSETKVDTSLLREILAGVPRSFPFYSVVLSFTSPVFGEGSHKGIMGTVLPGITLLDSWWVNGRSRSLTAVIFVDAEAAGKKLPPLPEPLAVMLAALGKATKTRQLPLPEEHPARAEAARPERMEAVREVAAKYRAQLPDILERVAFPHVLASAAEARQATGLGETTGPKKPVLVRAFKPLGYDCKSGSGSFSLRRRTPANLTLEISLDVGTWSRNLTASFRVHGLGFSTRLPVPVAKDALTAMQYPIGDAHRWQQLVDNMAAFVIELERSFVPAVEAAAGPSPDWYKPES